MHRRLASLGRPTLFTELIQHRKLHDRDPRLPILADKLAAKDVVAARLGTEWIIPTWWSGTELPRRPVWPLPFVVKARHGCNQTAFVRSGDTDWEALRRRSARWMRRRYGVWLDEWLYAPIPRGLIVEPFVGTNGTLPLDYKFFVFGCRVQFIQVHLARETAHRWLLLDRAWRPIVHGQSAPPRPGSLAAMIDAAEALAAGFDFVRVDLYEIAGVPKFGEMTFYPGSGLLAIDPPALDADMGAMWRAARRQSIRSATAPVGREAAQPA